MMTGFPFRHQNITTLYCIVQLALLLQQQAHFATSLSFIPSSSPQSDPQQRDQTKYASDRQTKPSAMREHTRTTIASSVAKTERREKERSVKSRALCDRCKRPPILCVCPSLPSQLVSTSTNVLVLQHPREFKRKSLSTVPLMPLVLEKCSIKVGYNFTPDQLDLVRECLQRGQKPLLLFPGNSAISLDKTEADGHACDDEQDEEFINVQELRNGQQLLILIDGTWAEAKRMIIQSPILVEQCQQVQFTAENESIYDVVRKEPEKHCISTLEACSYALTLLEPDEICAQGAKEYLEGSMKYMVEKKLKVHEIRNPEPRFTKPGVKIYEKNKRRFEIKEELFKKG